MKYFKLYKWDLIRKIRHEKEEEARMKLKIKQHAQRWVKLAKFYEIL